MGDGPDRPRVLVAGGYGVFGRLLASELLAATNAHIVLAGRDVRRAEAARLALAEPSRAESLELGLADDGANGRAAAGCAAVACSAGPFQLLPSNLPSVAVRAGAHWFDVADEARWVLGLLDDRRLDAEARTAGVVVAPGLSAVPAVSGVLARWCGERLPEADRA